MRGFVRQHWLPDDIANCENVRDVGALLFINLDKAALGYIDARKFRLDFFAVRAAPNAGQNFIKQLFWRCVGAFEADSQTGFLSFNGNDFGVKKNAFVVLRNPVLQGFD